MALSAGAAVVSTPFPYANEVLRGGVGRLVPYRDQSAMEGALAEVLANGTLRRAYRQQARRSPLVKSWRSVGELYLATYADD
jgi:glycosyltransferase involved in cell wall biosynthesis